MLLPMISILGGHSQVGQVTTFTLVEQCQRSFLPSLKKKYARDIPGKRFGEGQVRNPGTSLHGLVTFRRGLSFKNANATFPSDGAVTLEWGTCRQGRTVFARAYATILRYH